MDCMILINKYYTLDQNIKGERLFNTIYHELFHVICYNDGIDVNQRGEEPIAKGSRRWVHKNFKQNPKLWDILQDCLYGKLIYFYLKFFFLYQPPVSILNDSF